MSKPSSIVSSYPPDQQSAAWDTLWQQSCTPWDRCEFSPALRTTLRERHDILGDAVRPSGERRKALVPGCGRGWDVLLLASFGYDAYGLDVSAKAVEACKELELKARDELPAENASLGKGKAVFVKGNFFEDDWRRELGVQSFDIIYDYTFFCALDPTFRPKWALRMSQLLNAQPEGRLICLEWPRDKDPNAGGPPFASPTTAYIAHLSRPGKQVSYDDLKEGCEPGGFERLAHFRPRMSFKKTTDETGQVEEMVAIWQKCLCR
ncbi:hypothetical protein KEM56_003586 [Ascosphaera pollenicola]|nr:hypothetical protein KEM56_003586 [Ascosphaera pollenicola]